jgi:hypothetical protein
MLIEEALHVDHIASETRIPGTHFTCFIRTIAREKNTNT